jgi:hypothetical protein
MATEIKDKYSAASAFSITLTSLLGSTANVGRQSSFVNNQSNRFQKLIVYARLQQSGTVSGSKAAYVYGLRGDAAGHATDSAASGDGAITFNNAQLLGVIGNKASPAAGEYIEGEFIFDTPGPEFAIGITHDTCSTLSNLSTGQWVKYIGVNPEAQ